jgi:hypothetical protein
MYSPPFSFVSFDGNTAYSLPVREWSDVSFQVYGFDNDGGSLRVELIDGEGNVLDSNSNFMYWVERHCVITLGFQVDVPKCFRVRLAYDSYDTGDATSVVSNLFHRDDGKHTSRLSYLCDSSEFDFTYTSDAQLNRVRLPMLLNNPQYPQSDSIYKRFTGKRVTLSATIDKEWELETGYLSDALHEKLLVALSHDSIWVDGKSYTKSDEYSIDWGSPLEQNGEKTAKASCKVSENVTYRNSSGGDEYEPGDVFNVLPRSLEFEAA